MKKKLVFAYLVCFGICSIFAESADLLSGLDAYSRGDWTVAEGSFERVLITAEPNDRTEALYWLVMSEASAQNYERALKYADAFLEAAPEDERAAEVSYQKGRLLHLSGEYEASSDILYRFIEKYPDHPKIPSAYYWIGENLYATGNHTEARQIFSKVVVNYPQSGKVNEARYKIVLIDQQSVREELLQMANETQPASAQTEKALESAEPKSDDTDAPIASDSTGSSTEAAPVGETAPLADEKQTEYFADRLRALEKKINEISATLSLISEEQENLRIREQQQQKEQEEAERQKLERRRLELAELKARTQTLEKLYEQHIKGVK